MTKNINLYKKLYQEKKYEELIYKIENLEKIKSAQVLHILGICKLSKKNISNNDKLSAREDFRKAFESEKNSNIGIEALTNFINVSTDFLLIDDSLKYYNEIKDKFDENIKLLKSVSRIYQFSLRTDERIKILEKIIDLYPSSIDDWCSYIYINNFKKNWKQLDYFENSKKFSQNIKIVDTKKIKIDNSIFKRKIKIAFFSSDINQAHSVTYFLKPVLKNINKNKFEIYVISNSKRDEYKDQYKKYLNDWFNIRNLNDLEAINFIREKKIDIIFDLMGFTSENRINLFFDNTIFYVSYKIELHKYIIINIIIQFCFILFISIFFMKNMKGEVNIINLPYIHDSRGDLTFVEGENHIPFEIKRVYFLYNVPVNSQRGGHAHM